MRRPILVLLAVGLVAVVVLTLSRLHSGDGQAVAVVEDTPAPTHSPEPLAVVDVSGAVAHPGVYRLAAGSRIVDALIAAGGMTGEADLEALNKAAPIHDGQRIYVPRPGETVPPGSGGRHSFRPPWAPSVSPSRCSSRRSQGSGWPSLWRWHSPPSLSRAPIAHVACAGARARWSLRSPE